MKNNDFLQDLHIGKIIKEIAVQKRVSSKELAAIIKLYQNNADKIYHLDDMDVEDIVHISYLLQYNILEIIAKKYLSHLPYNATLVDTESYLLKIDMRTQRIFTCDDLFNKSNFLGSTYIGQEIRKFAKKKGWNEMDMSKLLQLSQSSISDLYMCKSLKIKKLIRISNILQYHFIAEVYLSQMNLASSQNNFDGCIIILNSQKISIMNPNDKTILMVFQRNDDKK